MLCCVIGFRDSKGICRQIKPSSAGEWGEHESKFGPLDNAFSTLDAANELPLFC
jgi:hypothetical protein